MLKEATVCHCTSLDIILLGKLGPKLKNIHTEFYSLTQICKLLHQCTSSDKYGTEHVI